MKVALERTDVWKPLLEGKRVALLASAATAREAISALGKESRLVALFGPEHGLRGNEEDGVSVSDGVDGQTGLPVFSLYKGEDTHLDPAMGNLADVLVVDIQDLGLRFYTYIATLKRVLLDCAEMNLPVVVLDRPNPLSLSLAMGSPLEEEDFSFVGPDALPIRYGLSFGELALWFEKRQKRKGSLTVIPLSGWRRHYLWSGPWKATSPAITSFESAFLYSGLCFLEGTNLSEGRGTDTPFCLFGSPTLDSPSFVSAVKEEGFTLLETTFVPQSGKWKGEACHGVRVRVDSHRADPIALAVRVLSSLPLFDPGFALLPPPREGKPSHLERLLGRSDAKLIFSHPAEMLERWRHDGREFLQTTKEIWLYE